MNTGEVVTAVILAATLVVVCWYAWEARKQAGASMKMAVSMDKQRLDGDRPYLLVEELGLDSLAWEDAADAGEMVPAAEAVFPKALSCRVYNGGRGPAKEIVVTVLQSFCLFEQVRKDLLRPGEGSKLRS